MKTTLTLLALSFFMLSCEKKAIEQELSAVNPPVEDYSLHCEESFVADWCSANLDSSEILEVCSGTIAIEGSTYSAIALKTEEASNCYLATNVSQTVSYPGCALAIDQQYVADLNQTNPFNAVHCVQANRRVYFDGETYDKIQFRALRIE